MNRNEVIRAVEVAKLLPVMEAWLEGKAIQCRPVTSVFWVDVTGDKPAFGDSDFMFRIKPEPRRWAIIVPVDEEPYLAPQGSYLIGAKEIIEVAEVLK